MKFTCFLKKSDRSIPIVPLEETAYPLWIKEQSDFVVHWLSANHFNPKTGHSCLIPDQHGNLQAVILGIKNLTDHWALARGIEHLPAGHYHVEGSLRPFLFYLAWGLAQYRFTRYKAREHIEKYLVLPHQIDLKTMNAHCDAIYSVRDLINTPTEDMGPQDLSTALQLLAKKHRADFKEVVGDALLTENFPTIHAVGRASSTPPRFLELNWGEKKHPRLSLVGKGVCFDSGGLDLKSSEAMRLMKKDMGGAAHVLGLGALIMEMNLPIQLQILIGAVENAVSGNAYRPGDIIRTRKGLTVEVGNTDAEGRLVVADLLTYALESDPCLIIDLTTLTGAARVALGTDLPALFSNNDTLAFELCKISREVADPVWHMPLFEPYLDYIKPDLADLSNNSSSHYGGAITAALFLKEFTDPKTPWVHLDLMAWNELNHPGRPRGGEAMGLRTLYHYFTQKNNLLTAS